MKRCPECRRNYYDDTLLYCLDDGNELLDGPATVDEPATAILLDTDAAGDAPARAKVNTTNETELLPAGVAYVKTRRHRDFRRKVGLLFLLLVVVVAGGFFGYKYFAPTKQIESIAVMPFVNEGGNADVEYLSDGMTETLISSLSQLPNLSVKARSSVFRYKGRDTDLKTIGTDLNVQAILTGRVVPRGEQLTLSLSLVDAATENVIWSEQYIRKQTDLVSLQSEIARDVSRKLRSKLTDVDEKNLAKNYPQNTEAYHLYLQGHFYWDKQTENGYKQAIDYFNKAIEKDPNYALAYSGLANTYIALGIDYSEPKAAFPFAKLYAQKALDLEPDLAEAHAALGSINFFYEWNWSAADAELKRVIELDPESTEPYSCTLHYLDSAGEPDAAVAEVKRVAEQHPTSIVINAEIGCSSYYAHQYDQAITELQNTILMDPGFFTAYYNLGRAYGQKRMYKEASAALVKANELSANTPYVIAEQGYTYAAMGDIKAANDVLKALEDQAPNRYVDPYLKAIVYVGLADKENAL
ncbi:MAG: tetratricopeptide repeat protein, partial [Acidobacteriota bacterium]